MTTIKLTKKQEAALIWAINIFEMVGAPDYDEELAQDWEKASEALAPIYTALTDYANEN